MPLLFYARELGVALVDDHVQQRVAHLLGGHLAQVFPLAPSLERSKLDFLSVDRSIEGVELEAGNLVPIDADLLAPLIEQTDPVTEGSDFWDFSRHEKPLFSKGHRGRRTPGTRRSEPPSFVLLRGSWLCSSHVQPNGLDLGIVFQSRLPQLPSEPGTLVSTERQRGVHHAVGVDPHCAGPELPRHLVSLL